MSRAYPLFLSLLVFAALGAPFALTSPVVAEEKEEAKEPELPPLASDEEAAEALKKFKVDFKARGLKGDEKLAKQDWAMSELAKCQHEKVVKALAKVTKNRNEDLRTAAVLQLGTMISVPGPAGKAVVDSMGRNKNDTTFLMAGLEAIGMLRFLGAPEMIVELLKHHDYAVQKNALNTMGALKDPRFIEEIIKLMKALRLEKGAKWDGVNVTYDTGTAGDHDQKMAEKIGKAKEAKNKKKGKRAAKSQRDLGPIVLQVAKELTGVEFTGSIEARKWLNENRKQVDEAIAKTEAKAKEQMGKKK